MEHEIRRQEQGLITDEGELIHPDINLDLSPVPLTREEFERGVEAILTQQETEIEEAKHEYVNDDIFNKDTQRWLSKEIEGKNLEELNTNKTYWADKNLFHFILKFNKKRARLQLVLLAQLAGILPERIIDPKSPQFSLREKLFLRNTIARHEREQQRTRRAQEQEEKRILEETRRVEIERTRKEDNRKRTERYRTAQHNLDGVIQKHEKQKRD